MHSLLVSVFGSVLTSNAIVIPYHHEFLPPNWEKPICSPEYNSSTDLVLFLAREFQGPEQSLESLDIDNWGCFHDVFITSGGISEKNNVYNKGGAEKDSWWNRGPNFSFDRILDFVVKKNYTNFFLMETDTIPQKDYWLEELDTYFNLGNYYILGGSISENLKNAWNDFGMPSYFLNHINGNAIYNLDKPFARQMFKEYKNYAIDCLLCGKMGKSIFPSFLSSKLSFDVFFSYMYEFYGYSGYVSDDSFLTNFAGVISPNNQKDSLFFHQFSGYEYAKVMDFEILNLTLKENKNPCSYPLPSKPFFIVNDNEFNVSKTIPTTDDFKYVLNALPRNSSYCTDECLEETNFCKNQTNCFFIDLESIVFWPLDAYIECASSGIIPPGSEYVTKHANRYVLLDRSKIIVESPVKLDFHHIPVIAASHGGFTPTELGAIIGGSVGGALLCGGLLYLCSRRNTEYENE